MREYPRRTCSRFRPRQMFGAPPLCEVCNPLGIARGGLEKDKRRRRLPLGGVHGEVGIFDDLFRSSSIVGNHSSPDGDADPESVPSDEDFPIQGFDKSQTDLQSKIAVDIIGKDRELIAPKAREQVAWPRHRAQPLGYHLENAISKRMPIAIIDALEVV